MRGAVEGVRQPQRRARSTGSSRPADGGAKGGRRAARPGCRRRYPRCRPGPTWPSRRRICCQVSWLGRALLLARVSTMRPNSRGPRKAAVARPTLARTKRDRKAPFRREQGHHAAVKSQEAHLEASIRSRSSRVRLQSLQMFLARGSRQRCRSPAGELRLGSVDYRLNPQLLAWLRCAGTRRSDTRARIGASFCHRQARPLTKRS